MAGNPDGRTRRNLAPILPSGGQRSVGFWYMDGNTVIKADSTYFKLHRSLLEMHCGYFKRIFAERVHVDYDRGCQQGQTAEVIVDGYPVHELKDVRARDFDLLLRMVEDPL